MVSGVDAYSIEWDGQDCLAAKRELNETWKWVVQGALHHLQRAYSEISEKASKVEKCVVIGAKEIKVCFQNRILPILKRVFDPASPNFEFQNKIDALGEYIEQKFAPLVQFNEWLNSNGQGAWYKQLAIFLAKLPLRAARNIILMVYNVIKGICTFFVHPVTSVHEFIKSLKALAQALLIPDTWSKIGIGMIGAGLGNAAVTGNPMSVIALGIGLAMLVGGLTAGSILAAREMRVHAVGQYLLGQAKQLPEVMLTGFLMGLIMGGIQRHTQKQQMMREREEFLKNYKVTDQDLQESFDRFIREVHPTRPQYAYHFSRNEIDRAMQNELGRRIIASIRSVENTYEITSIELGPPNPIACSIPGRLTGYVNYTRPNWYFPSCQRFFVVDLSKIVDSSIVHPISEFAYSAPQIVLDPTVAASIGASALR